MKPLLSESQDTETLQDLGRASVQIVHDLKNQLNGLKLYATFLRKRLEKHAAPADEQETIAKLIAGLERAAADTTVLVRYGRPVELRRQPAVDVRKILASVIEGEGDAGVDARLTGETGALAGEFDMAALREAFGAITTGARSLSRQTGELSSPLEIHISREQHEGLPKALIEWRGVKLDGEADPFRSFAGGDALRMALAAKIIKAHGGEASRAVGGLRVTLPLSDNKP
jgi:light-regulated signal transduction histidine kinase (bacteriophytochrome)